jgi:hypothetical protein
MLIWHETPHFQHFTQKVPLDDLGSKSNIKLTPLRMKVMGVTEAAKIKISNSLGSSAK